MLKREGLTEPAKEYRVEEQLTVFQGGEDVGPEMYPLQGEGWYRVDYP